MSTIPLTRGKVTAVSKRDFKLLSQYKWHSFLSRGRWNAIRTVWPSRKKVYMHRQILGVTSRDVEVDHRDGNGLNNYRRNLRKATSLQNSRNMAKVLRKTSSKFKGVCWEKRRDRWVSMIRTHPGQRKYLGAFIDETRAAQAYDTAARKHHGRFARLNFPKK